MINSFILLFLVKYKLYQTKRIVLMINHALLIGNSDGIGLGLTRKLLKLNWKVTGISRSSSPIEHVNYNHSLIEVQNVKYQDLLKSVLNKPENITLCVYCAGIGELLDFHNMETDIRVVDVNLISMVKTAAAVIPRMVDQGYGHFIGLSSFADDMLSYDAPGYHASKAGFSNYLESMALALKSRGVHVTNVRFGFVDTKMAKGNFRPLMMSVEKAVDHLVRCIDKKPIRYSAPRVAIPLVKFRKWMLNLKVLMN